MKIEGVFFDCWDTLIKFRLNDDRWNYLTLKNHCINSDQINWEEVDEYTKNFYFSYYKSHSFYEIDVKQSLELIKLNFHINLDCSIETCSHEILTLLSPEKVKDIDVFLDVLENKNIPYFCLSNTIYDEKETFELLKSFYPNRKFLFLLVSSKIGVKKPNPLFFQCGVNMAYLDIKKCIYIGDSFYQDCYGSYKAGFYKSVLLSDNDSEKEIKDRLSINDFPYIKVSSYSQLLGELKDEI